MIVSIIIMILITVGYGAFFFFVFPLLFPAAIIGWVFFISFMIVNVSAIFLSWVYFDRTNCYQDEGNPIAMVLYYLFGHDLAHIILGIMRWITAISFYFSVFGLETNLFGLEINLPPQDTIWLVLPIAIFSTELTFNIHAITTHWNDICDPVEPAWCPCKGEPNCYCDIKNY